MPIFIASSIFTFYSYGKIKVDNLVHLIEIRKKVKWLPAESKLSEKSLSGGNIFWCAAPCLRY